MSENSLDTAAGGMRAADCRPHRRDPDGAHQCKKSDKDLAGLTTTLDAASATLAVGKPCDSIKKLDDFKVKVDQLIAAERFTTGEGFDCWIAP